MLKIILFNVLGIILLVIGIRKEERIIVVLAGLMFGMGIGETIFSFKPDNIQRRKEEIRIEGYYQNDSTFVVTDSTIIFKR